MKIIRQSRGEECELYWNKLSIFYKNWLSINKYQYTDAHTCLYILYTQARKKDNIRYYSYDI